MNKKSVLIIFSILAVFGFFIAVYQYAKEFQAEFAGATGTKPANGHLWSEMECDGSGLCINGTNVGIGTATPAKKLEVAGSILASGTGSDICNAAGACLSQINNFIGSQALVNNVHNYAACTEAGGTIIDSDVSFKQCRFNTSSCPSGWTQYKNFSTTAATHYGITICVDGNLGTCLTYQDCEPHCTTGSHAWSNTIPETCTYGGTESWNGNTWCRNETYFNHIGSAGITQIGCY